MRTCAHVHMYTCERVRYEHYDGRVAKKLSQRFFALRFAKHKLRRRVENPSRKRRAPAPALTKGSYGSDTFLLEAILRMAYNMLDLENSAFESQDAEQHSVRGLQGRRVMNVGKKCLLLGIILISLSPLRTYGRPWGEDVLIYEGQITCFDVDYTMDGTMYVGFQIDDPPCYTLCFYTSSDHGYTWEARWRTDGFSLERFAKIKILVGEPAHNEIYCFFVQPSDGLPRVSRIPVDFSGMGEILLISDKASDEAGFDAARAMGDDYSMEFVFYSASDSTIYACRSTDYGESWDVGAIGFQAPFASQDLSIAWGHPSNYYLACAEMSVGDPPDSAEIALITNFNDGVGSWSSWGPITTNSVRDKNPHVAASNDEMNPAIWIAETYLSGGVDAQLCVWSLPSPDSLGTDWTPTLISSSLASEHCGDIMSHKEFGNPSVSMAWVYDDGCTMRDVHRMWSGGDDPTKWHDDTVINDHMAHPWFSGAAPQIVYSPGVPGGGVIYAGFGFQNLYFDAQWITGVEESGRRTVPSFSVSPTLTIRERPIKLSIPWKGIAEVSLYDICGRRAFHLGPVFWNEGVHALHLNQLGSGVYFLELKINSRVIGMSKLVILE